MRVDLVVLDIAGTTVYDGDAVHRCLTDALALAGVAATRDEINRVMGMPKPQAIATLVAMARGTGPDEAELARLYAAFERMMIEHYRAGAGVREADGATDVMRRLRASGVKVALDTGFARSITNAVVTRLGWDREVVDLTVSSDDVARGRPHPDMILEAMKLTGVADPSRVAKVGDTPADLLEGTAARCGFVIGVTSGSHHASELEVQPHTHLISSLRELLPIVAGAAAERAPGDTSSPLLFTPGPLTTSAAVKQVMLRDVGSRDREFIDIVARVRTRLLQVVNAPDAGFEAVLLQGSGTYAVEAMLRTFVSRDSGRLLVIDNGAYGARMTDIANAADIDVVVLAGSPSTPVPAVEVACALAAHEGFTHVAAVHCETTTGVLNPIREIGAAAHAAGCRFLVDAMSSFGAIPIDVVGDGVDVLASSANKCLEGVPGCAFVIAKRDLLQSAPSARSLVLDLGAQWRGFERDGQFRFTPPTQVVLALDRALTELELEGGAAGRAARYRANHDRLLAGMRASGFVEVVARPFQSDIITAFLCPGDPLFNFDDFYERLRQRNLVIYPGKVPGIDSFRIGTIGRLYPEDVDALVAGIREVLDELGVTASPRVAAAANGYDVVGAVAEFFSQSGGELYFGEAVTQREHALQCASLAEQAGAPQALVVAALLHDIGHLLHGMPDSLADDGIDGLHEVIGQRWLNRFFGPEVSEPVRLHVDAKRYLCATDPDYTRALSPASRRTLELQGGPLRGDELSDFADRPFALDAVRLRRWDDHAKTPGVAVPDLAHYAAAIRAVARRSDQ